MPFKLINFIEVFIKNIFIIDVLLMQIKILPWELKKRAPHAHVTYTYTVAQTSGQENTS